MQIWRRSPSKRTPRWPKPTLSGGSLHGSTNGRQCPPQIENLSRELRRVGGEEAAAGRCAETEELQFLVASLTAERDQLQMDLRENVEMVSLRRSRQTCRNRSFGSDLEVPVF